nr:helix-turn-helix transcriptional regulator [bacterium]
MDNRFGKQVNAARTEKGMGAKELARKVGVSEQVILDIESGRRVAPGDVANRLSRVLGLEEISVSSWLDAPDVQLGDPSTSRLRAPKAKAAPVKQEAPREDVSSLWLSAMRGVVRAVPVLDDAKAPARDVVTPEGKIAGAPAEKAFYIRCPDDALGFKGVPKGAFLLCVPVREVAVGMVVVLQNGANRQVVAINSLTVSNMEVLSGPDMPGLVRTTLHRGAVRVLGRVVRSELDL